MTKIYRVSILEEKKGNKWETVEIREKKETSETLLKFLSKSHKNTEEITIRKYDSKDRLTKHIQTFQNRRVTTFFEYSNY